MQYEPSVSKCARAVSDALGIALVEGEAYPLQYEPSVSKCARAVSDALGIALVEGID